MTRRALRSALLAVAAVAAVAAAAGCVAHRYRTAPRVAVVDGDPVVQMMAAADLPNVVGPSLVPASLHSAPPDDASRVVGLAVGAVPRAYPIGLLDRFEVVNDAVPDLAFLVARCPLVGLSAVYDRALDGQVLEFENSGALWRDTLVFRDRSTGTYWSAATGAGLHGPLAGRRLRAIPAVVVRASDWRRAFPESLYMDLSRNTSEPLLMRMYAASSWQGVSGRRTTDARHKPKQEVYTLAEGGEALAFTGAEIAAARRVETALSGQPVTIRWDAALGVPRAYGPDGGERAVVPMLWFAAGRHYARVRTLSDPD